MSNKNDKKVKGLIIDTILKRCKSVNSHDVKVSFGYDSISYDEKSDMFCYMPNNKSYYIGKYKELYFEYINGVIFCFKPFSTDENIINTFASRVNNFTSTGDIDVIFYPIDCAKGEHLKNLIEIIDKLKTKEIKRKEEENRSRQ